MTDPRSKEVLDAVMCLRVADKITNVVVLPRTIDGPTGRVISEGSLMARLERPDGSVLAWPITPDEILKMAKEIEEKVKGMSDPRSKECTEPRDFRWPRNDKKYGTKK